MATEVPVPVTMVLDGREEQMVKPSLHYDSARSLGWKEKASEQLKEEPLHDLPLPEAKDDLALIREYVAQFLPGTAPEELTGPTIVQFMSQLRDNAVANNAKAMRLGAAVSEQISILREMRATVGVLMAIIMPIMPPGDDTKPV